MVRSDQGSRKPKNNNWTDLAKKVSRFARTRWMWLRDGTPLWAWLFVSAIIFLVPALVPLGYFNIEATGADRLRWSGVLFQWAGLAAVVWGLNQSRRLFERDSLLVSAGAWLKRLFRTPKPTIKASANLGAIASLAAAGTVLKESTPNTLEERVARLEADFGGVKKRLSKAEGGIGSLKNEIGDRIGNESKERIAGDRMVSDQLEEAVIGGIHLEVAGVAFLFVGILLASAPNESAWLLGLLNIV